MKMRTLLCTIACILILAPQADARIGIIVNKELYPSVQNAVSQYIFELRVRGHQTWLQSSYFEANSSPGFLRFYLRLLHQRYNLEGVIFIGDLPIAEYEIENEHDRYGYKSFPMDLYYMDLDGKWLDKAKDGDWSGYAKTGIFDGHHDGSGDRAVEIWVSRLTASATPGLGDEVDVINDYFERLKTWMDGNDGIENKLLVFGNDQEWPFTQEWAGATQLNFTPAETSSYLRSDNEDTDINWMAALRDGQRYAFITEHADPIYLDMRFGFTSAEYLGMPGSGTTTNTRFYNLFACDISRYTVPDFLGGLFAWGHGGLITIGSTKAGGMLEYNPYNIRLGAGDSFGEAFKFWLNDYVLAPPTSNEKIDWHYGMTLSGVGTLTLNYQPQCFVKLPNPAVILEGTEKTGTSTVFKLDMTNKARYPDALFAAAPHLPACEANANASRAWVKIYDDTDRFIFGFCALETASDLDDIWFAIDSGQSIPRAIYVVLEDRECNAQYRSKLVPLSPMSLN